MIGKPQAIIEWLFAQDREAVFEIKEHRNRRSLNANAYFHVLVQKIADVVGASVTEIKNWLLAEYGQQAYLEDGSLDWAIKPQSFDWKRSTGEHYRPTGRKVAVGPKDEPYDIYIVVRGSHTYDTAEMSKLIDGTVSEAKNLDIETMTPEEIERMMSRWSQRADRS